jgi:hypothetical protein
VARHAFPNRWKRRPLTGFGGGVAVGAANFEARVLFMAEINLLVRSYGADYGKEKAITESE